MSTNASASLQNDATDDGIEFELDDRTRRALTEYMAVLPEAPDVGVYTVVGQHENGAYTVDVREGRCTCADAKYRDARCKHQRRVAFATGRETVPAGVDHDPQLGDHVDGGPILAASDGGAATTTTDGSTGTDADETPAETYTYHTEPARVGGARYVRCERCGAESVPADPDRILHRDDCPEREAR